MQAQPPNLAVCFSNWHGQPNGHVARVWHTNCRPSLDKFIDIAANVPYRGLFYNRYEQPANASGELGTEVDINLRQQLVYHVLGTPQVSTLTLGNVGSGEDTSGSGAWGLLPGQACLSLL